MKREQTQHISSLVQLFVKEYHLEEGYRIGCVAGAWDEVMAEMTAGAYPRENVPSLTKSKFLKDGVLTCRMSSSMLRMQLQMNSDMLLRRLNARLADEHKVSKIILK